MDGVVARFYEHNELEFMVYFMEPSPFEVLRAVIVNGAKRFRIHIKFAVLLKETNITTK